MISPPPVQGLGSSWGEGTASAISKRHRRLPIMRFHINIPIICEPMHGHFQCIKNIVSHPLTKQIHGEFWKSMRMKEPSFLWKENLFYFTFVRSRLLAFITRGTFVEVDSLIIHEYTSFADMSLINYKSPEQQGLLRYVNPRRELGVGTIECPRGNIGGYSLFPFPLPAMNSATTGGQIPIVKLGRQHRLFPFHLPAMNSATSRGQDPTVKLGGVRCP